MRGEGDVKAGWRYTATVREHLEAPKAGRGEEGLSSGAFGGSTLISGLQGCVRINLYCFKPPSLW